MLPTELVDEMVPATLESEGHDTGYKVYVPVRQFVKNCTAIPDRECHPSLSHLWYMPCATLGV